MVIVRRLCLTSVLLFLGLTAGHHVLLAQDPVFRGGVDLVQLDVVVLDRNRRPVTGLTAADFTILDEGRSREIEGFAAVTLPPAPTTGARWTREIGADVVSNTLPDAGRVVIVLLDQSIPNGPATVWSRTIAHTAIDALGPNDRAAVIQGSPFARNGREQNLTADRSKLRAAIDAPFMGGGDLGGSGACLCGVCALTNLEEVVKALEGVSGRHKSILFIGSDISINDASVQIRADYKVCQGKADLPRERLLRAIDRANVTVHALDPLGLETLQAQADPTAKPRPRAAELQRQGDIAVFPDYSGGRTVLNTNAPESAVPAIFAESQTYYLLGFERPRDGRAGQRRAVRVRVNREGMTVRSRSGYYLPPDSPEIAAPSTIGSAEDAVRGLLPKGDLPLSLALTPAFQADGSQVVKVLVEVAGASTAEAGRRLDVAIGVYDHRARHVRTDRVSVTIPPRPDDSTDVPDVAWPLQLDPGQYELRIGVEDIDAGRTGSVYGHADVEDDARLALGGIALVATDMAGGAAASVAAGDEPHTPLIRRTFQRGEGVTIATQARRRDAERGPVRLQITITDEGDRVVHALEPPLTTFSDGGVAAIVTQLPLAELPDGRYLLSVVVTQGEDTARRDVPFEVRGS